MTEFQKLTILSASGSVQLRGKSSRRAAKRLAPKTLSFALASAFSSAASSLSQAITRLSFTLAGLASVQANAQAQSSNLPANLPSGGVAVHGGANIVRNGNTLNVNTTNGSGNTSVINWQSFNIGAGHTTNINQPSANSSSINRVVTNVPTQIHGNLNSNGRVIVVNQNGIAVGSGGVVDTAGFTASTLHISDADAKAGRLRFEGNALSGGVQVDGVIRSRNGDVMLIAPQIATGGNALVKADNGNVILGAGQSVEVVGRGLEGMRFIVQGADNKVLNLGSLQGNAVGVFAGTLRHSGSIQAQSASMEGGKVVLRAIKDIEIVRDASLANAPRISADGGFNAAGAAQSGGNIRIESAQGNISVGAGSSISANSANTSFSSGNLVPNSPVAGINAAGGAIEIIATQGRVISEAGSTISATGHPGGTIRIYGGQESRIASLINASSPSMGAADAAGTLQLITASNLGGTIQILSPGVVALTTGAELLASGDAGGGTILVGGDYQGANAAITNAQNTNISQGVLLEASARVSGDGGKIIAWADNNLYFGGNLVAKGGEQGGNGGFGETSGKNHLYFRGRADLSARRGRTGSLLLDPESITIQGGSGLPQDTEVADGIINAGDGSGNFTISESALEGLTGNVALEASSYIQFQGTFGINGTLAAGLHMAGDFTLRTRNAPADPNIQAGIYLGGWGNSSFALSAQGNISILAGTGYSTGTAVPGINSAPSSLFSLTSATSNITMEAAGNISLGSGTKLLASAGSVSLTSKLADISLAESASSGVGITAKSVILESKAGNGLIHLQGNTSINTNGSGIDLVADRFILDTLSTTLAATGAGAAIAIQTKSLNRAIILGGTNDGNASELHLSAAELLRFSAPAIRIGSSANTGDISNVGSTSLNFGSATVAIATGGSIQLVAPNAPVIASALALKAGNVVDISGASHEFGTIAAEAGTGFVKILRLNNTGYSVGTVDGLSGVKSGGTATIDFLVPSGLQVVTLKADVLAEGAININNTLNTSATSVRIAGPSITIDSNFDNVGNSGAINLGGTASSITVDTSNRALILDSSTADASGFGGNIQLGLANGALLNALTLKSSAPTLANAGVIVLPGTINLDGGNMLVNGRGTLTAIGGTTINTSGNGLIQFQGELQGGKALLINGPSSVSFEGNVGTTAALSSLAVSPTSGNVTIQKNLIATSGLNIEATNISIDSAANVTVGSGNVVLAGGASVVVNGNIIGGGDIVVSTDSGGAITMGSSSQIQGIYTGTGGKTISLTAQNDIAINKLVGTSKYTAAIDISGANKSLTTSNAGHDNFDGFGNISLGAFNAHNIGTSSAPIKVANLSGSIEALGLQGVYISGSAGNLEVAATSVNTTAGAAVMDISSVGNLQILGGAGISVIGSGKADIKLASDLSVQVLTGISGGGALSSVSIAANERIVIGAGANISNLGGLSLSANKNGYGIRFVDADTVATAAGSVNIAYASLNQIGSTVGQVLVGKAGLTSGDIAFEGTNAFNFAPSGAKNYSFISGGSISSTTLRTATLDQAGFRAVGNVDLSNFQLQGSAVTVAAQSDTGVITMNAAASILTIGNVGPASAIISGLTTLAADQNIRVTNSGGSIQVSEDIISKGQAALIASTTGITIDTGVTVKGVGRNPQPAAVILRGPDVTINGTVDASGWNVALMPYNPGSANASLGVGATGVFSLTNSDFSKITNADTILVGAADFRFRDVNFVGDVNVGTANLHIYAGDNTVTASSATAVSQAVGSVITTEMLHVDANDKSAVLLRPNLVNAFSGVTSGSNAGISFNNDQSFDIGTLGVIASDPNSTVSLTSLGAINNPNAAIIKAGVNVLLSAETGLGSAGAPLLVQSSGTSPLNLNFQLDFINGGNAGAYITSSSDAALTANTGSGVNTVQIKTDSGKALALASDITSNDNITLTSGTGFNFGTNKITAQSLTLTAANGAITTNNNSGLDVSAGNVVLSATTNIGNASQSIFVQADTIDLSVANTVPSQQNKIFMRAMPLTGTVLKASQFTIDDSNLVEFNLTASSSVSQFLFDFNEGNNATFNVNIFSPTAPIRLDAPGGLTFSGSGQYRLESAPGIDIASNVTVNNTLTIVGPSTVLAGATLAGGGTIDNTGHMLTLNGAIAPGGSGAVGELTISGAANLSAGTLLFDLDTTTSYDKLNVTGNVSLGAPIVLRDISGNYFSGDSFNLITFGNASGSLPTLDTTAVPDATYTRNTTATGNGSLVVNVGSLINRWRNTPTDQQWDTASNWTRGHVPTASENVVIDPTNTQVVTAAAGGGALTISLPGDDKLLLSGGSFNLNAGVSTIAAGAGLEIANALLTGVGTTLNLAGTLTASGSGPGMSMDASSAFNNSGAVQIGSGGFFQMGALGSDANGTYDIATGATLLLVNSTRSFGNTTTLNGAGTIQLGALAATTPLTLSSGIGGTFLDNGTIDIGSGNLLLSGFDDQLNALKLSSGGTLRTASSTDKLVVTGTLNANGGTITGLGTLTTSGTSSVTGVLALDGSNWVNSGALNFTAVGSSDSIQVFNNALFENTSAGTLIGNNLQNFAIFEGFTLSGGGSINNAGYMELNGASSQFHYLDQQFSNTGTLKLDGNANFVLIQPVLNQQGTLTIAGNSSFGVATLNNSGLIEGKGTINLGSGTLTNTGTLAPGNLDGIEGFGTLTVSGNLTLADNSKNGFDMSATNSDRINISGDLTFIGSTGPVMALRELGGVSLVGGELFTLMTVGGNFTSGNQVATTTDISFLSNADTPNKRYTAEVVGINNTWLTATPAGENWFTSSNWSRGAAPTQYHDVFINQGSANLVTISSGSANARSLRLGNGVDANTLAVSGVGTSLTVNNPVATSGILVDLTTGSTLRVSSGAKLLLGAGDVYLRAGGVLQLNTGTVSVFGGSQGNTNLNNQGMIISNGASVLGQPAGGKEIILDNQNSTGVGTIEVASGELQIESNSFYQNSSIKIGGGSTLTYLPGTFSNNGTIEIAGGTLNLGANQLSNFNSIKGAGRINTGQLFNEGIVDIGLSTMNGDVLSISGDYSQDSSGILRIRAFSPTNNDRLEVDGVASLAGTLELQAKGAHAFAAGQDYQVIQSTNAPSGGFSTVSGIGVLNQTQNSSSAGHFITLSNPAGSIVWDGSEGDSLWSNPLNWDLNRVPLATDTVIIDPTGAQTIRVDSGTNLSILSLSATSKDDRIEVFTNGTLSLGGGANTLSGDLWVNGGILNFAGNNTASKIELSAGQVNVNANATVQVGTLYLSQGNLNIAPTSAMNITSQGLWNGSANVAGGGVLIVDAGANLQISGAGNRVVSGAGTTLQVNGLVRMGLSNLGDKLDIGAGAQLLNQGIIVAGPAGSSTQTIGGAGLLDNQGGTIKIDSTSNAILNINTASFNVADGEFDAAGAGSGLILIESANSTLTGNVTLSSGTTQISQGTHLLNTLNLAAGGGTLRINNTATATLSDVTVNSNLQLFGGTVSIANSKTLGVGSSGFVDVATNITGTGSIENAGDLLITGASITPRINNALNLEISGAVTLASLNQASGASLLLTAGASLTHTAGNLTNVSGATIKGDGTINVGSGTLLSPGTIAPGSAGVAGKLTIEGKADLTGSTLLIDLQSPTQYDKLHVTQQLQTGAGMGITVSELSPFVAGGEAFQPLSYGGTASGPFPAITSLVSGKSFAVTQASALNSAFTLTASGGFVTNIFWDGGAGTNNWADAANWSTDLLPVANQNVTLNPSGSGAITLSTGTNVSGLLGLNLDATDALFITGGSLALPSSNVNLNGTVNLAGGVLNSNNSSDFLGSNFNWSGGRLQGPGATFSAGTVSLAGGGVRELAGVTLMAGPTTLSGGSLSLLSGSQLNTGAFGFLINSAATLSFDEGALVTAGLTNTGRVNVNATSVVLNNTTTQTGAFSITAGRNLSFANDVLLAGTASVSGGTLTIASGKTMAAQSSLNRGANSVTRIGGTLVTVGLETSELDFTVGGTLSGSAGSTLKVNTKWDDTNATAITGFDNVTIAQAAGDLNIRSNLNVANAMQLTAANGRVLSSSVGGIYAKSVNANASGDVQLRISGPGSVTVAAASTGGNISLSMGSKLILAGLSTAAGQTALVEAAGDVGQIAAITTAGTLEFDLNTSNIQANLTLTDANNNFGQGITVIDADQVILKAAAASPLVVSGQMVNLQAFGGNVQLGSSASGLDVTGVGGLLVVATGNITQAAVLNISGKTDLTATSGGIGLTKAGTYGGTVKLISGLDAEIKSNGALSLEKVTARNFTATAGGDITQVGEIRVGSGLASFSAAGKSVLLNNALNDFNAVNIVNAQTVRLRESDGFSIDGVVTGSAELTFGASIISNIFTASDLTLTAAGLNANVDMKANVAGATSFVASGGNYSNITYKNASTNAGAYDLIFATGNVTLAHAGATSLGIMNAAKLDLTSGGLVNQTGPLTVGNVRVSAAGQDILLTQTGNAISQFDAAGQNVSLTSNLSVDPNIAATGNVVINAQAINQTAGKTISAANFSAIVNNAINLSGANKLGSVAGSAGAGSITINDVGSSLVLNGLAAPASNINITSAGALAQGSGALSAIGVNLSGSSLGSTGLGMLQLNAGNSVSLNALSGDAYVRNNNANLHSLLGSNASGMLHYETITGNGYAVKGNVNAANVELLSGGTLNIGGAIGPVLVSGASSVLLDAQGITVGSATGAASSAVLSNGSLSINAATGLSILGGSQNGAFASVDAAGAVLVNVPLGAITVTGGSGDGAYARLDPTSSTVMNVTAGSGINLQGGSGAGAYAAIVSDGDITLNAPSLSMTAGSGQDADAVVVSNFGRITPPSNCNGCVDLNITPLGNGASNTGLFEGVAIISQANSTNIVGTQLIQIGAVIAAVQRDPDDQREPEAEITVEGTNCP